MTKISKFTAAAAAILIAGGLGVAQAQTAAPAPAPAPAAGADHSQMDHSQMGHGSMGGMGGGSMGGGSMGGMNHGGQGSGMDHGSGGGMMGGMGGMMGGGHGGSGGGMMGGGMGGMMKKMMCGFTQHTDGRLAYLKAELKLTDQQQAAWTQFSDAFKAVVAKASKQCDAMDQPQDHKAHAGVLGHLSMMEQHMTQHLEIVRGLKGAIEPLMAALNDDQKKIANEDMSSVMEIGMKMGH